MSRAGSGRRGVYVESPKNDIYTTLLIVALVAIVLACLLLFLEFMTYDFKTTPLTSELGTSGMHTVAWTAYGGGSTPVEAYAISPARCT